MITDTREVSPKYLKTNKVAMKTAIGVTIGVLAVVIAGASLYGIFSLNETIQSKPNQIQVSNYSAQIGSLQPQINSINNNVSSLSSLKSDISDIKGKLSDLETKINQTQQQAIVITNPAIAVARSIYLQGDVVHITAAGLDPQKVVEVQLLDINGYIVVQDQTRPDSTGRLAYDLILPNLIVPGNFQVRLVSGSATISQPIKITAYSGLNSASVSLTGLSYLFTAQTDRTVYQLGDMVEVFGMGPPNTSVYSVLTSPSGSTYTSHATVQPDGTYAIFYGNSQSFETGGWQVTVNNQGLARVLYLTIIDSSGNPSPFTFTARTDKTSYQAGESIWVSGVGLPFTRVSSVLTSPSGATYTVSTTTGSDGSYILSHGTSQYSELGYWSITLTDNGETRQLSVFVGSSSSSPFTFTAQTQKAFYTKGETIQVSGVGMPYTTVKGDFTSPSQTTYHVAVSSGADGSYLISFPTFSSFETGNWLISVTNWQETKTISIFLQP